MTNQATLPFLWKIGAPAGQGVMVTSLAMSKIATRSGLDIFDYSEYPSLIQGGHNTVEVLINLDQPTASKQLIDCLVCLDEKTFLHHQHRFHKDTLVVFDPKQFEPKTKSTKIALPLQEILVDLKADRIMLNMIALGASVALLDGEIKLVHQMITDQFGKKSAAVANKNIECAQAGFDYVWQQYQELVKPVLSRGKKPVPTLSSPVMTGNEVFSFSAAAADCRFFAAYPMTPASSILGSLAGWQSQTGMVVRHAEDEIGVINEALGASFSGARAAVATSGGGFALMVESISYAGIAELPIVVFLSQRPGPATGMPTWTEQGDLLFACHAGHGEFPKIVLAPGDHKEMLDLTLKAFDLADQYQTPVIIMSDKFLSESHRSVDYLTIKKSSQMKIDRGKTITSTNQKPYLRYTNTSDGISPRLVPGQPGIFYQANSYEHLADSHTTEDAAARIVQVDKRTKKQTTYLKKDFHLPQVIGDLEQAKIVFVSWGGNKGPIEAARNLLTAKKINSAFIHFTHVFPMDEQKIRPLFKADKRYLLVENNATGQFGQLLRQQTGVTIEEKILKYDGRPFYPEEIVAAAKRQDNNNPNYSQI